MTAQQQAVDKPGDDVIGMHALGTDAAHGIGRERAGRAPDAAPAAAILVVGAAGVLVAGLAGLLLRTQAT